MSTDVRAIARNMRRFYRFSGKTVVAVGSGGASFLDALVDARFVIAVDRDRLAMDRLVQRVRERGLAARFLMVEDEFLAARVSGDVVLFEFSLHEMDEARPALEHASRLAPETLVVDHAPDSRWCWYADEDCAVRQAWDAIPPDRVRRCRDIQAVQHFASFGALRDRLARQGVRSRERTATLTDSVDLVIPMPYRLALLGVAGGATRSRTSARPQAERQQSATRTVGRGTDAAAASAPCRYGPDRSRMSLMVIA